ncbi:MAG TPA: hypothetical protein VEC35_04455 [Noviherbaspirillum sp.]|nr:hypothetical protein [Noviherbaspirillum sp.]
MKRTLATIALAILALGLTSNALAQSQSEIGLTGSVGTTGVGAHATFPVTPSVNVRLGMGYLGYNYRGSTSTMKYDLDLSAKTYDALVDWYPAKSSSFRITGGITYNGNPIGVRGQPNAAGVLAVGGNLYNASEAGSVTGKVSFNKFQPYLGIGWGRKLKDEKGWSFSTDVGVLFQGSAKTSLSVGGCTVSAAVCNQLASDVARENSSLAHEMNKFKVYPVLRVGLSYKF